MKRIVLYTVGLILSIAIFLAASMKDENQIIQPQMQIVHLSDGDTTGLAKMRSVFKERNPGYDLSYHHKIKSLSAEGKIKLVFIQRGEGLATLNNADTSTFSVGDIVQLNDDDNITTQEHFDAVIFTVPNALPENIPAFIRPDWDPNITDVPGGCATETNAYRRILLTWLDKVGPYQYHALNAHRVRIMDSFTHYHPVDGGFDEFYLVQMAMPGARLYTSDKVPHIQKPENVNKEEVNGLLKETKLNVGDLVYLPRGIAHRGYGGVLAQVITVPGFVPGSEIGLDHHLKAINNHLSLEEEEALPYNKLASRSAVIK